MFRDIRLLVHGLQTSMPVLTSALLLIAFTVYTFGVFAVDLIGNANVSTADLETKQEVLRFRNLGLAMLTMAQFMHNDDSTDILDKLHHHLPHVWVFFLGFSALASFVLLNLVTAIIVQQALDNTRNDLEGEDLRRQEAHERDVQELVALFKELDTDFDGMLSAKEFRAAFATDRFKKQIQSLHVPEHYIMRLFEHLDVRQGAEAEPQLDLEEFVHGMRNICGHARSLDAMRLAKNVEHISKAAQKACDKPDLTTFANDRLRSTTKCIQRTVSLLEALAHAVDETPPEPEAEATPGRGNSRTPSNSSEM